MADHKLTDADLAPTPRPKLQRAHEPRQLEPHEALAAQLEAERAKPRPEPAPPSDDDATDE